MNHQYKSIVITGASRGLGAALAKAYAKPGVQLFLCARNEPLLEEVADSCRARGATVDCRVLDVADSQALEAWAKAISQNGCPDLVIANAGIFDGNAENRMETAKEAGLITDTNLTGAVSTVSVFLPYMQVMGHGRIVLIASLAALFPLADAPAYSASKAGVLNYFYALREYLLGTGIEVSVVLPGHIATSQTRCHKGELAGIISAQSAAQIIYMAIQRGKAFIAFPQRYYWLIRLANWLPWRLRAMLNKKSRFYVDK